MLSKAANRLINESSTYLLQHAYNPVNWQAWTNEALAESKQKNKPILLSIGYSACHWCHVMEEESFQDDETAQIINENFIPIKVDREERPDIDDIYMTAIQLMSGHGGWPLTVFLTPHQKPFYGGTYFPKEDRQYGHSILPGFKTLLKAIANTWETNQHQAEASAEKITTAIAAFTKGKIKDKAHAPSETNDLLIDCATKLLPLFDMQLGGFKGAPKFPQTICLQLCLKAAAELKQRGNSEQANTIFAAVKASLNGMACGGIYDHLGGGFARYSTDEKWLVPHFEKMLYDNALLVDIYVDASVYSDNPHWLRTACETLDFLSHELTNAQGGFYSALDADSEGVEGKFYVWKKSEIDNILGNDSALFCQTFGVSESGNFEEHNNVLFLNPAAISKQCASSIISEQEQKHLTELKSKVLDHRSKRIRPIRDEKILTSWSSLSISAFVNGYRVSQSANYLTQACQAAHFILNHLQSNNRLMHSFAKEQSKLAGYLDDYSFFVRALIDLASVDENPLWLNQALALTDIMLTNFYVKDESDFFYTADDQEKLIIRPRISHDGATPSASAFAVANLLKLDLLTTNTPYKQIAQTILDKYKTSFYEHPSQFASMIDAWNFSQNDTLLFILVTSGNKIKDEDLLFNLHNFYHPNKLVIVKRGNSVDEFDQRLSSLSNSKLLDNQPTIYMCQGKTCHAPTNSIETIKTSLNNH